MTATMTADNTWFTADTHFGHPGILRHQENRSSRWKTTQEMDEGLIEAWNSRVGRKDFVFHLGDFFWRSADEALEILRRLNGHIFLVPGNHDSTATREKVRKKFLAVSPIMEKTIEGQPLVLCHYAMRTWNRAHHGAWQLFGHSHGSMTDLGDSPQMDVGVDTRPDFAPYLFAEIRELLQDKTFEAVDHHAPERE